MDLKTIDRYLNNPNIHKMLNTIAYTEGTDIRHGYNTLVGGKRFNSFTQHPNIIGLRTKEGNSTAAGRYQITKTTWDDIASKLGLKEFTPQNQDRVAVYLMGIKGALDNIIKGEFGNAINKLGGTWVSLPSGRSSQPKHSWADVNRILNNNTLYSVNKHTYSPANINSNTYSPSSYLMAKLSPNTAKVLALDSIIPQINTPTVPKTLSNTIPPSVKGLTLTRGNIVPHTNVNQFSRQNIVNNSPLDYNTPYKIIQETNPYLGLSLSNTVYN